MGVVVFFVAILGALGAGAKILYSNEASGSTADFDEPRVQSAVINLWLVYLGISGLCAAVYSPSAACPPTMRCVTCSRRCRRADSAPATFPSWRSTARSSNGRRSSS